MKDERIAYLAIDAFTSDTAEAIEGAIRQALAERDAEIVDFARHEARVGEIDGWVSVADLLAFLEGKP